MKMKKLKIMMISSLLICVLFISLAYSNSSTGNLYKAFSRSVLPNDKIEQNITIRKYYNLTIRFRYSLNGSDLSFTDNDAVIVLKNSTHNIENIVGIKNGKIYIMKDRLEINSIKYVDVSNIDKFQDINNQEVKITFYGTKAYLTVIVSKREGNATIHGFITDDLTSQPLDGITIIVFEKNADPHTATPVTQNISQNGEYYLNLHTDSDGRSYDIYVKDYSVA